MPRMDTAATMSGTTARKDPKTRTKTTRAPMAPMTTSPSTPIPPLPGAFCRSLRLVAATVTPDGALARSQAASWTEVGGLLPANTSPRAAWPFGEIRRGSFTAG